MWIYISSSIAYITLFLISKDIIHITLFEGRTPDEIAMVWFLSFYPLFSKLIKFYTIELRMTRKWEL